MAALAVVEGLDVIEDSEPGVGPGPEARAVEELRLERGEEAFGQRIRLWRVPSRIDAAGR